MDKKKLGRPIAYWVTKILKMNIDKLPTNFRIKDVIELLFESPDYKKSEYRLEYYKVHKWISSRMEPEYRTDSHNNIPFAFYNREKLKQILESIN